MHPFQITPDQPIDLNDFPTRDEALFPVSKSEGKKLFRDYQTQIKELQTRLFAEEKHRLLFVIQAMDTGGKDGTIRDVFDPMAPQGIRVVSFKKPTKEELSHDYLWRIHKHVPSNGQVTVFNRSHYEDIAAVRVRELVPEERWRKRFEHIRNFETMLIDEGTTIIKIFLHISLDEQKERLQARLDEPAKNWKFNEDDLIDRGLWPKHMEAYTDIVNQTSTEESPWYVIPADRKWYRNLVVSQILIDRLEALEMEYPSTDFDPKSIHIE
ncbi:MAG: PPK2 family polyphosphate kinase [Verrucomicrobiota bacterium]